MVKEVSSDAVLKVGVATIAAMIAVDKIAEFHGRRKVKQIPNLVGSKGAEISPIFG